MGKDTNLACGKYEGSRPPKILTVSCVIPNTHCNSLALFEFPQNLNLPPNNQPINIANTSDWTFNAVFNNSNPYTLYPTSPPTDKWYGNVTSQPGTIQPNSTGGGAGAGRSGTWTGVTVASCYISPDPRQVMVLVSEMPYNGLNDNTRVRLPKAPVEWPMGC